MDTQTKTCPLTIPNAAKAAARTTLAAVASSVLQVIVGGA